MRPGNTLIPAVIVILAISATVGVYAFSVWPTDQELNVNTVQVTQPKNMNNSVITNTNTSAATNTNTTTVDATKDWKTFTNATAGYSIQYPASWAVIEQYGESQSLLYPKSEGTGSGDTPTQGVIIKKVPNDSERNQLTERVSVTVNGIVGVQGKKDGIPHELVTLVSSGATTLRISWTYVGAASENQTILSTLKFTATTDATKDWKTYTNASLAYTIKYPQDWQISTTGERVSFYGEGAGTPFSAPSLTIAAVDAPDPKTSCLLAESTVVVLGKERLRQKQGCGYAGSVFSTYLKQGEKFIVVSWSEDVAAAYQTYEAMLATFTFTN